MKEVEQMYLQQCRLIIEKQLGWGNAGQWTNQDFLHLSEMILEATGVSLSSTTLKRLWGKVRYNSAPNVTTLNVLAQFAGYADWRTFKSANFTSPLPGQKGMGKAETLGVRQHAVRANPVPATVYQQDKKVLLKSFMLMLLLLVGGVIIIGLLFSMQAQKKAAFVWNEEDFSFSGKVVTSGVPNTVIFQYDASAAPSDSIYLQQSARPDDRVKVPVQDRQHAAMYYYPGAYQAALLADDQPLKQEDFIINTKDWTALVERDPMPYYFYENIMHGGALRVPEEKLGAVHPDRQASTPWLAYYNVKDFGELYNDNFVLETALKSEFKEGEAVCQDSSVVILYENSASLVIPLSIPACLANVDQQLKAQGMKTEDSNLLAFGADFSDWVEVKCEARERKLRLLINQQLAYQGVLPQTHSKIIGIGYRFHGAGAVNYVRLSQPDGKSLYYEDFNG
ncbi:hypothetical protein WJR50_07005 [Catalinimonas sp. 4WD22]|uniref:hypothetical protein n=1 Tax=Catalinimonas locisalis TaxID=3133978 RepID=UPI003101570C